MAKYLLSNFSLDMVDEPGYSPKIHEISKEEFDSLKSDAIAVVKHPGFARLLKVPMCKKFIRLHKGDIALVVGTVGGKLDYNAHSLPDHLSLKYRKVEIVGEGV